MPTIHTAAYVHSLRLGKEIANKFDGNSRSDRSGDITNTFVRFPNEKVFRLDSLTRFVERHFSLMGYRVTAFRKPTENFFQAEVIFKPKKSKGNRMHLVVTPIYLDGKKLLWITAIS